MKVLAIDPGPERSGWLLYDAKTGRIESAQITDNGPLALYLENVEGVDWLAYEMVACYGMPVGAEVFDTCVWIGRFIQAWADGPNAYKPHVLLSRKEIKLHLCQSARAKDSNIRQALIDRFGPGKAKAIGLKKTPGPLYGLKSHLWAALAVAVTAADQRDNPPKGL